MAAWEQQRGEEWEGGRITKRLGVSFIYGNMTEANTFALMKNLFTWELHFVKRKS